MFGLAGGKMAAGVVFSGPDLIFNPAVGKVWQSQATIMWNSNFITALELLCYFYSYSVKANAVVGSYQ